MRYLITFFLLCLGACCLGQTPAFEIAGKPWEDSLGNHRVVVSVDSPSGDVEIKLDWRRRDRDASGKVLLITDSLGNSIKNILIKHIDREKGDFIFKPTRGAGTYYVYYMPWSGHKWEGGFEGDYLHQQPAADAEWLRQLETGGNKLQQGRVRCIQARTAFDSFYPMEVVAKASEVAALRTQHPASFLLFPEDRLHSIKMTDDLPFRWIQKGPESLFSAVALRNEYYVFQVGAFASRQALENIRVSFKNAPFPITCFNTEGVDSKCQPFTKKLTVDKGKVQALWLGIDVPKDAKAGVYTFQVQVAPENSAPQTVQVKLRIKDEVLKDRGDSDLWRLSRLRWLNSRKGIDLNNTEQYRPLAVQGHSVKAQTATVQLTPEGLPASIQIGQRSLLAAPVRFDIATEGHFDPAKGPDLHFTRKASGLVQWESNRDNNGYDLQCKGSMESDGYLRFSIQVKAHTDINISDIWLQLPVKKELATYFMGMGSGQPFGRNGGYTPNSYDWKWKGPQNAYWLGSYDAGIYCKLLGASYDGPMLNLYRPAPPPSWYNDNKGGFKIRTGKSRVSTTVFTGQRLLKKDSTLTFEFSLLVTPVKALNTQAQFSNRYYQNYGNPYPPTEDIQAGVNVINVHHANRINPYINYPFVMVDSMRAFVNGYHKRGVKTKIYYTIRELSNQCAEIWALRSLGTEIFSDGKGGGYPWLREHLVDHYDVQWFTPIDGYEACDAAIRTSGQSRWYNYYVEGLGWLVKNVGIDGLYLDDVAYDRNMLKRMRKVMDQVKPGCMIDLHSNTDFSKGPATQYTEFFPYINKIWFGENFHYEKMQPDNWLVETSGIPFGLMGNMLFRGGNPWRGMLYGMTSRDGWPTDNIVCNPKPLWKALDSFGIQHAKMLGYWLEEPVVCTSDPQVLATAYKNGQRLLIALASWNEKPVNVQLQINWKALGLPSRKVRFVAGEIQGFQQAATFEATDLIPVQPGKGWLFIVK